MEQTLAQLRNFVGGLPYFGSRTFSADRSGENGRDRAELHLAIVPRTVTLLLVFLAVVLLLANTGVIVADELTGNSNSLIEKLAKAFSVDMELNIPAYFSTLLLLLASVLLACVAFSHFQCRKRYAWHWSLLAAGFFVMSFDEIASVHEKLIEPMRSVLGSENLGIFYYAWVVPAIALVLLLGAVFLRFCWDLPKSTRSLFIIAAILYLSGALGLELAGGAYAESFGKENLTYKFLVTVEEALEMIGTIIFIKALFDYIANNFPRIQLHFQPKPDA